MTVSYFECFCQKLQLMYVGQLEIIIFLLLQVNNAGLMENVRTETADGCVADTIIYLVQKLRVIQPFEWFIHVTVCCGIATVSSQQFGLSCLGVLTSQPRKTNHVNLWQIGDEFCCKCGRCVCNDRAFDTCFKPGFA